MIVMVEGMITLATVVGHGFFDYHLSAQASSSCDEATVTATAYAVSVGPWKQRV